MIAFLLAITAGGVRAQGVVDIPAPGEETPVTLTPSRSAEPPHTVPSIKVDPCPTPSARSKPRKSLGNSGPYPTDREELEGYVQRHKKSGSLFPDKVSNRSSSKEGTRVVVLVPSSLRSQLNRIEQAVLSLSSQSALVRKQHQLMREDLDGLKNEVGGLQGTMNKVTTSLTSINATLNTVKDRLPENLDEAVRAITAREGIQETVQRLGSQRPATADDLIWMGGWQLIFAALLVVAAAIAVRLDHASG